jgi:DNA replication initiation complex subunit (GINS family)
MKNCLSVDNTLQEVWMVQAEKGMYHDILNTIEVSRKAVLRGFCDVA